MAGRSGEVRHPRFRSGEALGTRRSPAAGHDPGAAGVERERLACPGRRRDHVDAVDAGGEPGHRLEPLDARLYSVSPMPAEAWDSLASEDLTEDEATAFWQAITG